MCCGCSKEDKKPETETKDYSEATEKFLDELDESNEKLDETRKARQEFEQAKKATEDAQENLDAFIEELELYTSEKRKTKLSDLSKKFEDLKKKTTAENEANTFYGIVLQKSFSSKNDDSIEKFKKSQEVQLEKDIKYIESQQKVIEHWCNGEISTDEYKNKMHEIDIYFGYASLN